MTLVLAIAIVWAVQAPIFDTGIYRPYLQPDSYAGEVEGLLERAAKLRMSNRNKIVLFGDSRLTEGFSEKLSDELTEASGLTIFNAAKAGASPRTWYYFLREIDPDADQFAAVMLPVDDYDDVGIPGNMNNRLGDQNLIVNLVRYRDLLPLAMSFDGLDNQVAILRGGLFKSHVLREDILDFIARPRERLEALNHRHRREAARYTYEGRVGDLRGVRLNPDRSDIVYPPHATPEQRARATIPLTAGQATWAPKDPSPDETRYRRRWLGAIADYCAQGSTRVIVFRPPLAPWSSRSSIRVNEASAVRDLARQNHVELLPEHHFEPLEIPELFFDHMHLNAAGRRKFTSALTQELIKRFAVDG